MDTPGVRQVPEGSGEQGKMEKTVCKIICDAPTTLAVKELMMMMMMIKDDGCILFLKVDLQPQPPPPPTTTHDLLEVVDIGDLFPQVMSRAPQHLRSSEEQTVLNLVVLALPICLCGCFS